MWEVLVIYYIAYHLSADKYVDPVKVKRAMDREMERLNIPFFVDSETGEVEHLFRANWSVIPPRLITRSGLIVH